MNDTEADRDIKAATDAIGVAAARLANVVVLRCHGTNTFGDAYRVVLRNSLETLLKVRDDIENS